MIQISVSLKKPLNCQCAASALHILCEDFLITKGIDLSLLCMPGITSHELFSSFERLSNTFCALSIQASLEF